MGLKRVLVTDIAEYEQMDPDAYEGPGPYNTYLLTPPRIYGEEFRIIEGGANFGIVWSQAGIGIESDSTIHLFSTMVTYAWPSYALKKWTFDGKTGALISTEEVDAGLLWGSFAWEPLGNSGYLWEFGGNPIADDDGAIRVASDFASLDASLGALVPDDFTAAIGSDPIVIRDFAIDRASDLVWVRWGIDAPNRVRVHRYASKEHIADLYTPNTTAGIAVTGDGTVFILDELDWLMQYSYAGAFRGGFRHPRAQVYADGTRPVAFGWDSFYKRLLLAGATANESDGASTVRIEGFAPRPKDTLLTSPLPLVPMRKERADVSKARRPRVRRGDANPDA
jgi:hypothetical protein